MVVPWTLRCVTMGTDMSDTNSVVSLPLTPHLTIDLSPLEADLVTGKTSPPPDEQIPNLIARLKPYATKVLAAIAACHGRTQAVVLSAAAICVLRCAGLLLDAPWAPGVVTEGKAISLVPDRSGYALVAKGSPQGTLFGLTILSEKDTHFFPINDAVANTKVAADIVSQLKAAQAQSEAAGEAAGVSQAELTVKVERVRAAVSDLKRVRDQLNDGYLSVREILGQVIEDALPPRSPDSRVMSPAEMSALFAACGAVYAEPAPLSEEDQRKAEDPTFLGTLRGVDIYSR